MSEEKALALRLADWLEDQYDPTHNQEKSAAELRRLHAQNEALLEALKQALPQLVGKADQQARAAIKAAEEGA